MDDTAWHLYPDLDIAHALDYGRWIAERVRYYQFFGDMAALEVWTELLERFSLALASYQSYQAQLAIEEEEKSRGIHD